MPCKSFITSEDSKKISVIVPVYKVESYLCRCVDSILKQTFTNFELILVDDGSPDYCGAICDEYAQKDNRIVVIHQKNSGLSAARNAGINWTYLYSNSEWITFIDSDDWIHPRYLELLYQTVTVHQVDVAICAYQETAVEMEFNEVNYSVLICSPEDYYDQNRINAIVAWGKLYKKDCFKKLRYPVGKLHEDEFTTYRILFGLSVVAIVKAKLYYYFKNENSIMRTGWSDKRLDALEAHREQIEFFKTKGYSRALLRSVRAYVGVLCSSCEIIEKTEHDSERLKELKLELKASLKAYRLLVPFKDCRWAYNVAYPRFTRVYGMAERVTRRLWRKIRVRN